MRNWTVLLLIFGAALSRLIPHIPNVTAVTAVALLGGAYLTRRNLAIVIPLAALFLSDLILGFHSTVFFVYGAVLLISLLSFGALKREVTLPRLAVASLSSSLLFFFISNLGVFLMDHLYEKSATGLVNCYLMALPFLGTQVIGDLIYTGLLFGAVELIRRWNPILLRA